MQDEVLATGTEPLGFLDRHFRSALVAAVALGATVRLLYVLTDRRGIIGGDGFLYHLSAWRLADGLGYTSPGANLGAPAAHYPPGWITVLGAVSWLGARSQRAHQLTGVVIGIGVVVVIGYVGRTYFSARVGIIAAGFAALYPGFWVIEGNMLSEPLGLLLLGLFMLAMPSLRSRPTIPCSLGLGALCGVLALARYEQVLLLLVVIVPTLANLRQVAVRRRATLVLTAVLGCGLVLAPWTLYNQTRFKRTVVLSTNTGFQLLVGNCPPGSYSGERLGFYVSSCNYVVAGQHPGLDRSELDVFARSAALHNMADNIGKFPVVVPARFGRLFAVFRPSQTVGWVADWMTTDTKPIWAWVVSYWLLVPLAIVGTIEARRRRAFLLPLLAPVLIMVVNTAISYGEPRYHTMSDLGVLVLAAVGLDHLVFARRARATDVTVEECAAPLEARRSS
jgi:4-amino-4-deoxy-L-arabinose transferase-like glycosyltransferase